MQIQPRFFIKPYFIAALVLLILFFIPIDFLAWMNFGKPSGFDLVWNTGVLSSPLVYVLWVVPITCLFLIYAAVTGQEQYNFYVKKAALIAIGAFLVISILSIFHWGFWLAVISAGFLWWDSQRDASAETPESKTGK